MPEMRESYDLLKAAIVRSELQILTEGEFAQAIEVEPNTLQVWRSKGQGPDYLKLGKSVFYAKGDVLAWIAESKRSVSKSDEAQG